MFVPKNLKYFVFIWLTSLSGCGLDEVKDFFGKEKKPMINIDIQNKEQAINLFPKSVSEIQEGVAQAIELAQKNLDEIKNIEDEKRNFENTARALDIALEKFSAISSPVNILQMVTTDDKVREACSEAITQLDNFAVDILLDVELYKAFKNYVDINSKKEDLNDEQKYYLVESIKDFERSGLNLPSEELEEVKKLKKQIAKLSLDFSTNIAKDQSKIEVGCDELAGLNEEFISNLKKSDEGKFILGCDYPTYFEVTQNCSVESTRKALYLIMNRRAYPQNIKILEEIIDLRDDLASKLNFESYAAIDLDPQMAKKPKISEKFLLDLSKKVQNKAKKEITTLKENLPEGVVLTADGKIQPWDLSYVKNQYKKKSFDIDEREIAKYFPMEKAVQGIFDIYQQFFGLKFKISDVKNAWHEDVQLIEVYQKDNNELRGYIFLDLYPRKNKFSHACMCDVVSCVKYKDSKTGEVVKRPAVIVVIANFPKSTKTKPSLLKHDDVVTFFHEFGHAMHGVLGRTQMTSFAGTNTKTDFVEVPSQMLEEWMWDKDILQKISSHYQTGESLSADLIEKKLKLKKIDHGGYFVSRQVTLSLISLDCFKKGKNKDTDKIIRDLYLKFDVGIRFEPKTHFQTSFGHLTDYAAKYYSYMWSKVFALDLFDYVKKYGLLNYEVGKRLIDEVLGKGGSEDPDKLLIKFLGREPNQEAFLKDIGV
jgi:thimet oligopeptidase